MASFSKKLRIFGLFAANSGDRREGYPQVTQTLTLKPIIGLAQWCWYICVHLMQGYPSITYMVQLMLAKKIPRGGWQPPPLGVCVTYFRPGTWGLNCQRRIQMKGVWSMPWSVVPHDILIGITDFFLNSRDYLSLKIIAILGHFGSFYHIFIWG